MITDASFEELMEREHAAYLQRIRTGDLGMVVGALFGVGVALA